MVWWPLLLLPICKSKVLEEFKVSDARLLLEKYDLTFKDVCQKNTDNKRDEVPAKTRQSYNLTT